MFGTANFYKIINLRTNFTVKFVAWDIFLTFETPRTKLWKVLETGEIMMLCLYHCHKVAISCREIN